MSLIGTLEQIGVGITNVLQRIETYQKTGLFVVKQGAQWVELYFREGRLLCTGPIPINVTLGDQLLQSGYISAPSLQEVLRVIGGAQASEMRMALTLMDLGYIDHEELRTWAIQKTCELLRGLLTWSIGEVYFEDDVTPPADRLLIALSVTTLLASLAAIPSAPLVPSAPLTASGVTGSVAPIVSPDPKNSAISSTAQESLKQARPSAHISNAPTLLEPSQFFLASTKDVLASSPTVMMPGLGILAKAPQSHTATVAASPVVASGSYISPVLRPALAVVESQPVAPQHIPVYTPPRIDISFMQPDMVLMPADLSALRGQDPQIALTPDQWRLLTRVDGQTSLQQACQLLAAPPEILCQVAGELIALGLIHVVPAGSSMPPALPVSTQVQEGAQVARELVGVGQHTSNGIYAPAHSAYGTSAILATPSVFPQYSPVQHDIHNDYNAQNEYTTAAQSQWGNGANGTTFVPRQGWVAPAPQPFQPLHPTTSTVAAGMYAHASSAR